MGSTDGLAQKPHAAILRIWFGDNSSTFANLMAVLGWRSLAAHRGHITAS